MLLNNQGVGEQKRVMYHEMSCNRFMHKCKELLYFTNRTEIKYSFGGFVLKSSQVTFIYIALLTIQIVTKHCTISK